MNLINRWLLKYKLKNHSFTISGYNDNFIRIVGERFLTEPEVELVHKWKNLGKIVKVGNTSVSSPHGNTYNYDLFKYKTQ